ncbi:MAG: hypothetical protein MZV64_31365 [Ignavibacteriales bacterium]|nr:hypothetical protein [Ignavibacteriales bacterium]
MQQRRDTLMKIMQAIFTKTI